MSFKHYKINCPTDLFGQTEDGRWVLVASFADVSLAESYVDDSHYVGKRKRNGKLFRPESILRDYVSCSLKVHPAQITQEFHGDSE